MSGERIERRCSISRWLVQSDNAQASGLCYNGRHALPWHKPVAYATVSPTGLLLTFGERNLRYWRILPPKDILEHRVNRQWLCVPNASKQR